MIDPHQNVLQAQALELHRQRAPGIRVDAVLGAVWDHFAIRQGPGGHPALGSASSGRRSRTGSTAPSSPARQQH